MTDTTTTFPLVLGLDTFGDRTSDTGGRLLSHAQSIRDVVTEGVLADQAGVDFFGIGEHHTDDFPMPAGDVVLAAIAARTSQAREEFWPHYRELFGRVARERGFAVPTEASFRRETGPDGALYVGAPQTVARKIAANLTTLGANRFDLKYGMGRLPHEASMTAIELYGTQVIPLVRELAADAA